MKRKPAIWICVLLAGLVVCGLVVVGLVWHQYQTQRLVKGVHSDLLLLAKGLEAFSVDRMTYPSDEQGLQFLVHPVGIGMAIRTPKSYLPNNITQLPNDPFNLHGRGMYGYAGANLEGKPFGEEPNRNTWILTSYGPDCDRDIDPQLVRREPDTWRGLYGDLPLEIFAYDPTNGLISNGDIYRIKQ